MRLVEQIVNISSSGDTASESTQLQKPITVQMYKKSDIAPAVLGFSQWKKDDWVGEMKMLLQHFQMKHNQSHEATQIHHTDGAEDNSKGHTKPFAKSHSATKPIATSHTTGRASKTKQALPQQVKAKVTIFCLYKNTMVRQRKWKVSKEMTRHKAVAKLKVAEK